MKDNIDKKVFYNLTDAIKKLKDRIGFYIDKFNLIGDKELIEMIAKDFKHWQKAIRDKNSAFWTKNGNISFMWGNTLDYIQKNSK